MIEIEKINKSYGNKLILNNINLKIYPDEVTFIVGTSGAGKTTLMNIIGGLSTPDSGKVFVDKNDISQDLNKYRSELVGYIFQDYNLIKGLSVKDNVVLGQLYSGNVVEEENLDGIDKLLCDLNLKNKNQKIETLSGGEKQRTAFARSIFKNSRVIIADEPSGNLDSVNADKVFNLLVNNKKGRHVIVVSHDISKAQKYADRIIEIKDGEIVEDYRVNSLISDDKENKSSDCKLNYKARAKACWMLGLNSIKTRLSKILSIILVVAITISAITLVINAGLWGSKVTTRINKYYLESDMVSLSYSLMPNCGVGEYPFSEKAIDEIRKKYSAEEIVSKYYMSTDDFYIGNGSNISEVSLKEININSVFEERVMSNEIEGRFIQSEKEIIIAESIAKELFPNGAIGEVIKLYSNGFSVDLTIVGVNYTMNPFDKIYSFISSETLKLFLEKELEQQMSENLNYNKYMENIQYGIVDTSDTFKGKIGEFKESTNTIIIGRAPHSIKEIVISSSNAKGVWGEEWKSKTDEIFSNKYIINFNGLFDVCITGVFESEELIALCDSSLLNEMKKADPIKIDVYLPDSIDTTSVYSSVNNENEFLCEYLLEKLKAQVDEQTSFFRMILFLLGIILTIISAAMLNSFAKITILERKRELAIVKSLGANNIDLNAVLLFDSLFIAVSSFISSILITFGAIMFLPKLFNNISYIDFEFPWLVEITVGIAFGILILICTAIHFCKEAFKTPAELMVN